MKNKTLALAMAPILLSLSNNTHAALAADAVLNFEAGAVSSCIFGPDNLSYTGCEFEAVSAISGSYFGLDTNNNGIYFGIDSNNVIDNDFTLISQFEGIRIGQTQTASGSHGGSVDGTESPSIDNPWNFFGSTGMHQTTSDVNILSDDGNGNVTLDFSGWGVTWNGINAWHLGDPANFAEDTNIATLTCAIDCSKGDTYILEYFGHSPIADPSGTGGVPYYLRLEGTVSAVPVPAAVWLFGSGLLGLFGWKRRKRNNC